MVSVETSIFLEFFLLTLGPLYPFLLLFGGVEKQYQHRFSIFSWDWLLCAVL